MRVLHHQPIVDFPLEHHNIFTKESVCSESGTTCNLVEVLGQQP
jgi:hypothetical protein